MSYEELVPFYEEVEGFLGVAGPEVYPWEPARKYPLGPLPINAPGLMMQKGFAAMGLRATAGSDCGGLAGFCAAGVWDQTGLRGVRVLPPGLACMGPRLRWT